MFVRHFFDLRVELQLLRSEIGQRLPALDEFGEHGFDIRADNLVASVGRDLLVCQPRDWKVQGGSASLDHFQHRWLAGFQLEIEAMEFVVSFNRLFRTLSTTIVDRRHSRSGSLFPSILDFSPRIVGGGQFRACHQ